MRFGILGPVEIVHAGVPVELGGAKERALLVRLLLDAGRTVPAERLIDDLWETEPPDSANVSLRVHVSRVRKALGAALGAANGQDVIVTRSPGYALALRAGDEVDAQRFQELLERGRERLRADAPQEAARTLADALALWRGPALAGVAELSFVAAEAARLEEERLGAIEDRIEADLACGRHATLIAELESLTGTHRTRERIWGQRMIALYRSGRQAEALEAFRDLRALLAEELGIDPSPDIVKLEAAILAQDPTLSAVPPPPAQVVRGSGSLEATFLFTDIEGSTRLWELDPDGMPAALARHDEILRDAVAAHDGRIFATAGDSVCATFSSASEALRAALEAQAAFGREPWKSAEPIRVRMGLHAGEAEVRGADFIGPTLNRCARITDAGHGGQVVLSASAVDACGAEPLEGITFVDLGAHRLPDLAAPERLFQPTGPDLVERFPPLRSLEATPNNLPTQVSEFIGREEELRAIVDVLGRHRLITLVGVGGVGKTRIGLQVAADLLHGFPHGVWVAGLGSTTDPALVPKTIAASLGVREPRSGAPVDALVTHLRTKTVLLVVDNCEHVIDGAAACIAEILHACPSVRVLATSREPLGIDGEHLWPTRPLGFPEPGSDPEAFAQHEAIRLFVARAKAAEPGFAPTGSMAGAIAEICRRVDGLPLAIELAAARVQGMAVSDIAERLGQRFRLLTGGNRTAMPRHRTLQAAIDWSHDLLSEPERVAFRRLSVFPGPFTLGGAEAIVAGDDIDRADALDLVLTLVRKSLVLVRDRGHGTRYWMLDTIRQYAADKLTSSGEADAIRRRHAEHCLAFAEAMAPRFKDARERETLPLFEAGHHAFRSALRWAVDAGEADLAERLCTALSRFWASAGHLREGATWFEQTLEAAAAAGASVGPETLAEAGYLAFLHGKAEDGERLASESVARSEEAGDAFPPPAALFTLASVRATAGAGPDQARQAFARCVEAARALDDGFELSRAQGCLGAIMIMSGEDAEGTALCEEAVEIARATGSSSAIGLVLLSYGTALFGRDPAGAITLLDEASGAFASLGQRTGGAWADMTLGLARAHVGDQAGAVRSFADAAELFLQLGDLSRPVAQALEGASRALMALHRFDQAATLLGAAEAAWQPDGVKLGFPFEGTETTFQELATALHEWLGEERLARGMRAGHGMSPEEAIALIRRELAELDAPELVS